METLSYLLPALACPIGMGLVMWLMMRGRGSPPTPTASAATRLAAEPDSLARLRARLADVEAEHAATAAAIERLTGAELETRPASAESQVAGPRSLVAKSEAR